MERDWTGVIVALSKKMALRYGVVNISDIRLNPANDGIEFVLTTGDVVNVPFDSSELPFNGEISDIDANNVQDAIDWVKTNSLNKISEETQTVASKVTFEENIDVPDGEESGNAVNKGQLDTKIDKELLFTTTYIYIDGNRTDTYVEDGTILQPFKTLSSAIVFMNNSEASGFSINIAYATYTEDVDLILPNKPITVYGNNSTIINVNHTITITNPYFIRYNLFTSSNIIYSTFLAGARSLVFGGRITGDITNSSYVEFTECQLSGGTISTTSEGQTVCTLMSSTSKFTSEGILVLDKVSINTEYVGYLVTSTTGQLTITNSIVYNGSIDDLAGSVSCDNGATTNPNMIINNVFTTLSSNYALFTGTANTIYSKNHIVANNKIMGSALYPVNTDITGFGNIMALGSDANGDTYYNSDNILTRMAIGDNGYIYQSDGTKPVWVENKALNTMLQITDVIYVDNKRTDTYTEIGTYNFPFKTISSAISYIISLGFNSYVNIEVNDGVYDETILLEDEALKYIVFTGRGYVVINPSSGNALQSTTNNGNLFALHISNIVFSKPVVLTGENGTSAFMDVIFNNINFNGTGTINATCINKIALKQIYSECNISFANVNYCYLESSQFQGDFSVSSDDTSDIPSSGGNFSMIANGIYFSGLPTYSILGVLTMTFAITGSRWGTTGDITVPNGVTIYAYSSFIRGTNTNNGVIVLRGGSSIEEYVEGAGTLTLLGNNCKFNYYNNSNSGLSSINVEGAIDELTSKTYSITLPITSGGVDDWQAVEGGYELSKIINGLTTYSSIVSVADDDTIWTTNGLNATIAINTLTFFVSSLPSSEVGLILTITKSTNGGTL
ncbi:MAG: hypothetical protein M0R51_14555 [Clostridia bacterium]|jgi:hypothetical protein|nr:hypothetical protein [Clostridia bacterium]